MLVHVGIALLSAAVTLGSRALFDVHGVTDILIWVTGVIVLELLVGHAPRGRALRIVEPAPENNRPVDPGAATPGHKRWYIETASVGKSLPSSCSFVEFDERGDYLDFWQHRHAYEKILSLASSHDRLTVVVYVHGWRHSGQSHDVIAFAEFLSQLNEAHSDKPRRIHGVYLAWRGAALRHIIPQDEIFKKITDAFGCEIVDLRCRARFPLLTRALETLSYFDRKGVPEHKFSGTSLSRTLFSCALAAKRNVRDCETLLIGHSFGALMLERTFQNAAISALTAAWSWGHPERATEVNPLPFDTVLLVNSAAPSIYAKQFQSYLAAHRQAMVDARVPHANVPIIFSLTSTTDWATGLTHPLANSLCFLVPSLRRQYLGTDFTLERVPANAHTTIRQSYYYRHTPGHNPLIVNRFIEEIARDAAVQTKIRAFQANLSERTPSPMVFATNSSDGKPPRHWQITFPPVVQVNDRFSRYQDRRPVAWTTTMNGQYKYKDSAYWVIRCPAAIIAGHNDIWSQAAMDTYAALHRIASEARAGVRVVL
jgi:hypothetical protein